MAPQGPQALSRRQPPAHHRRLRRVQWRSLSHKVIVQLIAATTTTEGLNIAANEGWVSLGIDHDTAAFAVESIRRWWRHRGRKRYPDATRLLITADCGGSNGARVRLWKVELQKLADQTGITITVAHHPPGTSKWNRIEHRMFAFITQNWRGKPLLSHKVIVQLIAATTTTEGLNIACAIDAASYPKGAKISDRQIHAINMRPDTFHPDWNYTILPKRNRASSSK